MFWLPRSSAGVKPAGPHRAHGDQPAGVPGGQWPALLPRLLDAAFRHPAGGRLPAHAAGSEVGRSDGHRLREKRHARRGGQNAAAGQDRRGQERSEALPVRAGRRRNAAPRQGVDRSAGMVSPGHPLDPSGRPEPRDQRRNVMAGGPSRAQRGHAGLCAGLGRDRRRGEFRDRARDPSLCRAADERPPDRRSRGSGNVLLPAGVGAAMARLSGRAQWGGRDRAVPVGHDGVPARQGELPARAERRISASGVGDHRRRAHRFTGRGGRADRNVGAFARRQTVRSGHTQRRRPGPAEGAFPLPHRIALRGRTRVVRGPHAPPHGRRFRRRVRRAAHGSCV